MGADFAFSDSQRINPQLDTPITLEKKSSTVTDQTSATSGEEVIVIVGTQGGGGGTGLQGPQGFQGYRGYQGYQGIDGASVQGLQGIQGASGVGLQGVQGSTGVGTQGLTGLQGTQGESVTGTQGAQGNQGAIGASVQGSQGVAGESIQGVQGNQGNQGLDGAQGQIGLQGTQGDSVTGAQGTQGLQGSEGVGTQGVQGAAGLDGLQGAQGAQGDSIQGAQGAVGDVGAQGASVTGLQGAQGDSVTGLQGVEGVQGSQGVQGEAIVGPQGDIGLQGVQGAQGNSIQGDTGAQGFQGTTGPQGVQGDSIQGNQGDAIVGPQGVQGDSVTGQQGFQGIIGLQGDTGAQGFQGESVIGPQGATGSQGAAIQGAQGLIGETGPQGIQGSTGAQGGSVTGSQGFQGDVGAQGEAIVGAQGAQGVDGASIQGAQGITGSQGVQGESGVQGATGFQGVQGESVIGLQGSQGDSIQGVQGSQGVTGAPGDTGAQGVQGESVQGSQGFQGDSIQGAQGNQGASVTGLQGSQGSDGAQGDSITGPQGVQGFDGTQGATGPQGIQGSSVIGAQGDAGNQGFQGASIQGVQGTSGQDGLQGIQGASVTGAQGAQGDAIVGPQGVQGISVTGVQGTQGIQGSSIQGVQGQAIQGLQGDMGFQGYQGLNGLQGFQGDAIQGVQGFQGRMGVQGNQGSQGNQGDAITGTQGYQGPQGSSTGTQGAPGPQGVQGANVGYQGAQGSQGIQGSSTGTQGSQGYQGVAGTNGSQGYQGNQGLVGVGGTQGSQGLQGAGYQGVQGIQGSQGIQGAGYQGTQGDVGLQGYQGFQGAGYQGAQGASISTSDRTKLDSIPTGGVSNITTLGSLVITESQVTGLTTDLAAKVNTSLIGAASGVAPLGTDGLVASTYLPSFVTSGLKWKGTWDASTDTPTIPTASSDNSGWMYKCSVTGTSSVTGSSIVWNPGDWLISNGSAWERVASYDSVSSVNGYTGTVVLAASDVGAVPLSTVTARGDLIVATASGTVARLPVGTTGQALVADSTQTTGVKWATVSTLSVSGISSNVLTKVSNGALASSIISDDGTTATVAGSLSVTAALSAVSISENGSTLISKYLPQTAGSAYPLTGDLYARNIIPTTTATYALGSSSVTWSEAYVASTTITSTAGVNSNLFQISGTTVITKTRGGVFTAVSCTGLSVSSLTTQYGLTYVSTATGTIGNLGVGTSGQLLVSAGSSSAPAWTNVSTVMSSYQPVNTNLTALSSSTPGFTVATNISSANSYFYNVAVGDVAFQWGSPYTEAVHFGVMQDSSTVNYSSLVIKANAVQSQTITPIQTGTYNLGSSTMLWKYVYATSVYAGNAAMATWIPNTTYAWFGHSSYNNNTNGNLGYFQSTNGNIVIGGLSEIQMQIASAARVLITASSVTVADNLLPGTTTVYNLGNASYYWNNTFSQCYYGKYSGIDTGYFSTSYAYASFGHKNCTSNTNFCLLQASTGDTFLNGYSNISMQIANTAIASINSTGIVPATTAIYDLGSTSLFWRQLHTVRVWQPVATNITASSATLAVTDGQVIKVSTASTLTLPAPSNGYQFFILNSVSSATVTLAYSSAIIFPPTSVPVSSITIAYTSSRFIRVYSDGTYWYVGY